MSLWLPDFAGTGYYRTLLPWEHDRYAAHLLRLSLSDRRTRFMGGVSDDFIRNHARRALGSARVKVIGWFHGGTLRGVVEMSWGEDRIAEAAFSVEMLYRRQGVGTALAERALRAARNRGMQRLTILTEADNVGMRRLAARFGARFVIEGREVEGSVEAGQATPLSILFEFAEEELSFAASARLRWPWLGWLDGREARP